MDRRTCNTVTRTHHVCVAQESTPKKKTVAGGDEGRAYRVKAAESRCGGTVRHVVSVVQWKERVLGADVAIHLFRNIIPQFRGLQLISNWTVVE